MSAHSSPWWIEGLTQECVQFQVDLSSMVDGELDEVAGGRAIAHLEQCGECRAFFDDTRKQVAAHRDLVDPEAPGGLVQRYHELLGREVHDEVESIELICRLANIFYQLGKSYVLNAVDPGFRQRIFEKAVPLEITRAEGRGFLDGLVASGRGDGVLDWSGARHLFNGTLTRIEGGLEKGKRLLAEALKADASHEEASIYLAYVDVCEGKRLKAARRFQELFQTAVHDANRGHAAVQLALLHSQEEDYKKAIAYARWVIQSGLADLDDRFFFVRFNLGTYYARLRRPERSIAAFRALLDRHPDRAHEVAGFFLRAATLRACIDSQDGFGEGLLLACPELFQGGSAPEAPDDGPEDGRTEGSS